ncbi:MAG: molybdopterin-guanine dinucleotide biosynthesis protein B [Synergistaceae bacterium]|jgi:molybdopterin-guanine dinucleotide biosynthesis protein MobB|nr:molybdopterin-guanine dinucleotide biosynthesis protein B [Synergistaceae bacterium]
MKHIGAVIIAGGMSRRMGRDKATLPLGEATFLERISRELGDFDELLLSVDTAGRFASHLRQSHLSQVEDLFPNCGPIAGLYSALRHCVSRWLLAVSCDIPLFSRGLAEYLSTYIANEYDAVVAVTREGRIQPLCGIYSSSICGLLEKQIVSKDYRMMHVIEKLNVKYVSLRHSAYADEMIQNVNTPEQYADMRRKIEGPPVIAVSGIKNSGKTTLLENIIPLLKNEGLRVAVIKHDAHDFVPDVPGTDSFRMRQAGAHGVAVYSKHRYMVIAKQLDITFKNLFQYFPEVDLFLLEGGKNTLYPKLEILRSTVSTTPVCDPDTTIAVCADLDESPHESPHKNILRIDDYKGITEFLLQYLEKEGKLYKTHRDKTSTTLYSQANRFAIL